MKKAFHVIIIPKVNPNLENVYKMSIIPCIKILKQQKLKLRIFLIQKCNVLGTNLLQSW